MKSQKSNLQKLSPEQIEQTVAEYFGISPKYFLYIDDKIQINISKYEAENPGWRIEGYPDGTGPVCRIVRKA